MTSQQKCFHKIEKELQYWTSEVLDSYSIFGLNGTNQNCQSRDNFNLKCYKDTF